MAPSASPAASPHERLMDHVRHPRNSGLLDPADGRARDLNPLCGDVVEVTVRFGPEGRIAAVGFDGVGCSVSQGAASQLFERAVGRSRDEVASMSDAEVLEILGLELNTNRKKCAAVALRVLKLAAAPSP